MGLFFPSFKYLFTGSTSPRICEFYVRKNRLGEDISCTKLDRGKTLRKFTTKDFNLVILIDNKICFRYPNYFLGDKLYEDPIESIDITDDSNIYSIKTPYPSSDGYYLGFNSNIVDFSKISITLKKGYENRTIYINFISKVFKVPWLRWEYYVKFGSEGAAYINQQQNETKLVISGLPIVPYNGFISTQVTPASAIRVSQTIDQNMVGRELFISMSGAMISPSVSLGTGFGRWNFNNLNSVGFNEIFSYRDIVNNSTLNMCLDFKIKFLSMSMELFANPGMFTLIGTMAPAVSVVTLFTILVPNGVRTIEEQRVRYLYLKDMQELTDRVKDNFRLYTDLITLTEDEKEYFNNDMEEGNTNVLTDLDGDGRCTIMDRLYQLTIMSPSQIVKVTSPSFFSNPKNSGVTVNSNGISEFVYLVNKFSIIGRSICISDISNITLSEDTESGTNILVLNITYTEVEKESEVNPLYEGTQITETPKVDEFKDTVKYTLIIESSGLDGDSQQDALKKINDMKSGNHYSLYCKLLNFYFLKRYDRDFYDRSDFPEIIGIKKETWNYLKYTYEKDASEENIFEENNIYLVVRTFDIRPLVNPESTIARELFGMGSMYDNLNDKQSTMVYRKEHNDCLIRRYNAEERKKMDPKNKIRYLIPFDDTALDKVGVNITRIYYELIPGMGLKNKGGHGIEYIAKSPLISPGSIDRIFGELTSTMILLNPYNIGDILNGNLNQGSWLEIFSNMGREKDTSSPTAAASIGVANNLLGGDLDYMIYTTTETIEDKMPSNLIAYFDRNFSDAEKILYNVFGRSELIMYNNPSLNILSFTKPKDFSILNTTFNPVKELNGIKNTSEEYVVNVENYNIIEKEHILDPIITDLKKLFNIGQQTNNIIACIINPSYIRFDNSGTDTADNSNTISDDLLGVKIKDFESLDNLPVISKLSKIEIFIENIIDTTGRDIFNPENIASFCVFYLDKINYDIFKKYDGTYSETDIVSNIQCFGFYNNRGDKIPKIFKLRYGLNEIDIRNIDDPVIVFIVPVMYSSKDIAKGKESVSLVSIDVSKTRYYEYNDTIVKKPIGILETRSGTSLCFFSAMTKDNASTEFIACTEVNNVTGIACYPGSIKTEKNMEKSNEVRGYDGKHKHYELFKNYVKTQDASFGVDIANFNKYMILGMMKDAQVIIDYNNSQIIMCGMLYDEGFSPTEYFGALVYSFDIVNQGLSILNSLRSFEPSYGTTYYYKDGKPTEEQRAIEEMSPLFWYEGKEMFGSKEPITFLSNQKMAIFSIPESYTLFVFYIAVGVKSKHYISFGRSTDSGLRWDFKKDYSINFLFELDGDDQFIESVERITCLKYLLPNENNLHFAILCKISGCKGYQILYRNINYTEFEKKLFEGKPIELINKMSLAVGNVNEVPASFLEKIHVGNYGKDKDDKYIPTGYLKDSINVKEVINQEKIENNNINSIHNIDLCYDAKNQMLKIFYFNEKGIRSCIASSNTGYSWYQIYNF